MFWFKAKAMYKLDDWGHHVKDYNFSCLDDRKFNSALVSQLLVTKEFFFMKTDAKYGTPEYENEKEVKTKVTLYIAYLGNFILGIDKSTYDSLINEQYENKGTNLNIS